jgi:hypothetical protein
MPHHVQSYLCKDFFARLSADRKALFHWEADSGRRYRPAAPRHLFINHGVSAAAV